MNEMQSKLDTLTARVIEAEEWISDLEDKLIERKEQEEPGTNSLKSMRTELEINNAMKCFSVRIIGIPEGVKRGRED